MNIIKDEKSQRVIGRLTERQAAILLRMADPYYLNNAMEYFINIVPFIENGESCAKAVSGVAGVFQDLLDILRQSSEYDLKNCVEISLGMKDFNEL